MKTILQGSFEFWNSAKNNPKMNSNDRDKKLPKPWLDLNMDKLLDDKLIEVELRKEEPECDSYVRLLEHGTRDSLHFVNYKTQGYYKIFVEYKQFLLIERRLD